MGWFETHRRNVTGRLATGRSASNRRSPWWIQWTLTLIGHLLVAALVAIVGQPFLAIVYLGFMSVVASIRRRRRRKTQGLPARLQFTREGKSVVAIALGVAIAAINTGNNMLYLFLGMMLSLIIISGILSEITMRRLTVTRRFPEQIFAEKPVLVSLTLQNQRHSCPRMAFRWPIVRLPRRKVRDVSF